MKMPYYLKNIVPTLKNNIEYAENLLPVRGEIIQLKRSEEGVSKLTKVIAGAGFSGIRTCGLVGTIATDNPLFPLLYTLPTIVYELSSIAYRSMR